MANGQEGADSPLICTRDEIAPIRFGFVHRNNFRAAALILYFNRFIDSGALNQLKNMVFLCSIVTFGAVYRDLWGGSCRLTVT